MNPEPTPPDSTLHLHKILIPTDFSAAAGKAVRYAQSLGALFKSELLLLHVFHPPVYAYEGMVSEEITAGFHKAAMEEMQRRLDTTCASLEEECGLRVQGLVADGLVYEQVALTAKRQEVDLIVISTHGFTGLRHMVRLGSTAERIVRHAPCPVLVVREHERDFVG